ncbi:VWA domain-containing protein [Tahibacter caeni]|uniref:VWA domain-containing protein n=1 Tax=Tahibacter caeni TaxID=1453545 RepID=UPI002148251A|nr:VWA domain-containing protein [Tahibacter caeni]
MRHLSGFTSLACALGFAGAATLASAADQAMLVLDASGSMWGTVGGTTKIDAARKAVAAMLDAWPPDARLGVMAYGHRRKGDCDDIEILRSPGEAGAGAIRGLIAGLSPKGMTPISAAVRKAAEALKFTEHKVSVILVSDGEETCDADPCELGAELEKLGVDFTAHVVGFDLPEGKARAQLQCLANTTGGRYFEARDAAALAAALEQVAAPPPAAPADLKAGDAWMVDVNLFQGSYRAVDFTTGQTPEECQAICLAEEACTAWTYEGTGTYFVDHPRCHLKSDGAVQKKTEENMVSGVKPGVRIILPE